MGVLNHTKPISFGNSATSLGEVDVEIRNSAAAFADLKWPSRTEEVSSAVWWFWNSDHSTENFTLRRDPQNDQNVAAGSHWSHMKPSTLEPLAVSLETQHRAVQRTEALEVPVGWFDLPQLPALEDFETGVMCCVDKHKFGLNVLFPMRASECPKELVFVNQFLQSMDWFCWTKIQRIMHSALCRLTFINESNP